MEPDTRGARGTSKEGPSRDFTGSVFPLEKFFTPLFASIVIYIRDEGAVPPLLGYNGVYTYETGGEV